MDIQKVLIADDEKHIREILKMYCEKEGFDVIEAADGAEAILKVQSEKPDILILDIMMPVMDGLEASKKIRELPEGKGKDIPIIAMTANAFVEDKEKTKEAGMNAHLAKPLNMEKVIRTIYEQCSYKLNGRQQNKKPNL